jgi:hypothetical protein
MVGLIVVPITNFSARKHYNVSNYAFMYIYDIEGKMILDKRE